MDELREEREELDAITREDEDDRREQEEARDYWRRVDG